MQLDIAVRARRKKMNEITRRATQPRKDLSTMKPHPLTLTGLLALCLAGTVLAGEAPYGHRDFYPSPERPIRYRADGNGCFPGATPVTEWWEGTPGTVEVAERGKKISLPAFLDQRSKNIVWKARMPGWSDAQPAVIGDRLVAVCGPDYVVCVDAHTGKELWRDRLSPMSCDGLQPEEAAKRQEILDIARSMAALNTVGRSLPPKSRPSMLRALAARLDATEPDFGKEAKAIVKEALAADPEGTKALSALDFRPLHDAVALALKIKVGKAEGYITPAAATPISDGAKIWVALGDGQTACYDLNGKRLWSARVKCQAPFHHYSNPVLCGRALIVNGTDRSLYAYDADSGSVLWKKTVKNKGEAFVSPHHMRLGLADGKSLDVIALGADTILRASDGKVVGKFPIRGKGAWTGEGLDRVGLGNQVFMSTQGHFVGAQAMSAMAAVFTLQAQDQDTVTATPHYLKDAQKEDLFVDLDHPSGAGVQTIGWINIALMPDGTLIGPMKLRSQLHPDSLTKGRSTADIWPNNWDVRTSNMWNLRTGEYLGAAFTPGDKPRVKGEFYGAGHTVIGKYLLVLDLGASPSDVASHNGRARPDQLTAERMVVVDLSNPRNPRRVESNNLLGTAEFPSDLYYDSYIQGEGMQKSWFCGKTFYPGFGLRTSGPVACGNRFWVQSSVHLYCIGDPAVKYDWNPASRPEAVTQSLKQ